jgi:hypothetical protein
VFLYIVSILSYDYFIKFYLKDKTILHGVLAFIKTELKRIYFVIVVNNKYLNIISICCLEFIIIKGNKFLITSS